MNPIAVYVREDFLSPGECEAARRLFPPFPPHQAAVNASPVDAHVAPTVRRGRAVFLSVEPRSKEAEALCERLSAQIRSVNDRLYKFDLAEHEDPQLAEYTVGDHYDWHLDLGPGRARLRKLSASVQLSPADGYDGGELEIRGAGAVDRAEGTLIIFPSFLLHRVAPVTRGVRYSLVAWASGETSFR